MTTLAGTYTAMITPFDKGQVDYAQLKANVQFQIAQGINGLVPTGTTGESPTLSHDEHRKVIQEVIQAAAGKVQVIAGTGSNSTTEALALTAHAKACGADAALIVNPYYNKPSQEGLYRHFCKIADEVDLPIVLYNIPGRTNITMEPATVARLAAHTNIIAIKEATGSMDIASEIASLCDITLISGDDSLTLPLMSIGARGVISVLSNLMPAQVKAMVHAASQGQWDQARKQHLKLFPMFRALLKLATNPVTIKTALQIKGMDTGELRLPLCEMDPSTKATLEKLLV